MEKPSNISKEELVRLVAKAAGVSQNVVFSVYDAIFAQIGEGLKAGRGHTVMGYFNIKPGVKEAHEARNPMTGEPVHVPRKNVVKVSVSDSLLGRINEA